MKASIVTVLASAGWLGCAAVASAQTPGVLRVQSVAPDAACKNSKGAFLSPPQKPPTTPFEAKSASLGRIKVSIEGKDCFLETRDFTTGADSVACSQVKSIQPFDVIGGARGLPEPAQPRCDKP